MGLHDAESRFLSAATALVRRANDEAMALAFWL